MNGSQPNPKSPFEALLVLLEKCTGIQCLHVASKADLLSMEAHTIGFGEARRTSNVRMSKVDEGKEVECGRGRMVYIFAEGTCVSMEEWCG